MAAGRKARVFSHPEHGDMTAAEAVEKFGDEVNAKWKAGLSEEDRSAATSAIRTARATASAKAKGKAEEKKAKRNAANAERIEQRDITERSNFDSTLDDIVNRATAGDPSQQRVAVHTRWQTAGGRDFNTTHLVPRNMVRDYVENQAHGTHISVVDVHRHPVTGEIMATAATATRGTGKGRRKGSGWMDVENASQSVRDRLSALGLPTASRVVMGGRGVTNRQTGFVGPTPYNRLKMPEDFEAEAAKARGVVSDLRAQALETAKQNLPQNIAMAINLASEPREAMDMIHHLMGWTNAPGFDPERVRHSGTGTLAGEEGQSPAQATGQAAGGLARAANLRDQELQTHVLEYDPESGERLKVTTDFGEAVDTARRLSNRASAERAAHENRGKTLTGIGRIGYNPLQEERQYEAAEAGVNVEPSSDKGVSSDGEGGDESVSESEVKEAASGGEQTPFIEDTSLSQANSAVGELFQGEQQAGARVVQMGSRGPDQLSDSSLAKAGRLGHVTSLPLTGDQAIPGGHEFVGAHLIRALAESPTRDNGAEIRKALQITGHGRALNWADVIAKGNLGPGDLTMPKNGRGEPVIHNHQRVEEALRASASAQQQNHPILDQILSGQKTLGQIAVDYGILKPEHLDKDGHAPNAVIAQAAADHIQRFRDSVPDATNRAIGWDARTIKHHPVPQGAGQAMEEDLLPTEAGMGAGTAPAGHNARATFNKFYEDHLRGIAAVATGVPKEDLPKQAPGPTHEEERNLVRDLHRREQAAKEAEGPDETRGKVWDKETGTWVKSQTEGTVRPKHPQELDTSVGTAPGLQMPMTSDPRFHPDTFRTGGAGDIDEAVKEAAERGIENPGGVTGRPRNTGGTANHPLAQQVQEANAGMLEYHKDLAEGVERHKESGGQGAVLPPTVKVPWRVQGNSRKRRTSGAVEKGVYAGSEEGSFEDKREEFMAERMERSGIGEGEAPKPVERPGGIAGVQLNFMDQLNAKGDFQVGGSSVYRMREADPEKVIKHSIGRARWLEALNGVHDKLRELGISAAHPQYDQAFAKVAQSRGIPMQYQAAPRHIERAAIRLLGGQFGSEPAPEQDVLEAAARSAEAEMRLDSKQPEIQEAEPAPSSGRTYRAGVAAGAAPTNRLDFEPPGEEKAPFSEIPARPRVDYPESSGGMMQQSDRERAAEAAFQSHLAQQRAASSNLGTIHAKAVAAGLVGIPPEERPPHSGRPAAPSDTARAEPEKNLTAFPPEEGTPGTHISTFSEHVPPPGHEGPSSEPPLPPPGRDLEEERQRRRAQGVSIREQVVNPTRGQAAVQNMFDASLRMERPGEEDMSPTNAGNPALSRNQMRNVSFRAKQAARSKQNRSQ